MIIGLVGKINSGKTSIADYLQTAYGFHTTTYAEKLKEAISLIWDIPLYRLYDQALKGYIDPRWGVTPRFLLQRFGTQVCREIHPDTWIYHVRKEILTYPKLCIADVRYKNEAMLIKEWGGFLWRITRPIFLTDDHSSETEQDFIEVDAIINNDGMMMDDLKVKVTKLMEGL